MRLTTRILGILLSLLPFSASAQIASYIGAAPAGVINTPVLWSSGGSSGTVSLLYNAASPSIPGAAYVTYQQGSAKANTVTTYTTTFQSTAGSTGSLQAMCDDTCTVSVNGTQIGAISSFNTVKTFAIPALIGGTNTLSIAVTNATGNTGVEFSGTLTAAPATAPPAPVKPVSTVTTWTTSGPVVITFDSATNKFTISGSAVTVTKQ